MSEQATTDSTTTTTSSSNTSSSSPIIVPTPSTISIDPEDEAIMEEARENVGSTEELVTQNSTSAAGDTAATKEKVAVERKKKSEKKKKRKPVVKKKGKKAKKHSSDDSSSDSSGDETDSGNESDSDSSEDERERRRKKKKAAKKAAKKAEEKRKAKLKAKKRKSRKHESSSDDDSDSSSSSSSSDSDSDSGDGAKRKKKRSKKTKRSKKDESDSSSSDSTFSESEDSKEETPAPATPSTSEEIQAQLEAKKTEMAQLQLLLLQKSQVVTPVVTPTTEEAKDKKADNTKKGKLAYKRIDRVWDSKLRDYKDIESAQDKKDEFDAVFTVKRKFNWDGEYRYTVVEVKSNALRDALQVVLKDVKGLSLVEEVPELDPHLLFLYYDEIKLHFRKTLKAQLKKEKKRKQKKKLTQQIAHCKLLVEYIDKDYKNIRKKLLPMLKAGNITFDLMWAIFKPNTIAYTPTYGNKDDPRCFKINYCWKDSNIFEEQWWMTKGQYLEYDGKIFGMGSHSVKIDGFKGARKITSLPVYPLSYHKDEEGLTEQLIERGKKFVALQGMNYRFLKGLGYMRRKLGVAKINVNGRVIVDPATFRRIQANYPVAYLKSKEDEGEDDEDESDASDSDADSDSDDKEPEYRVFKDKKGNLRVVQIPAGANPDYLSNQKLEPIESPDGSTHTFTEQELLTASPVVLGYTLSEKMWLEFSLSGISEIQWNSEAFDSLVLEPRYKQNLKGLVSSHRYDAAKTIDDVIQGKGKGLNVVLHGPPGVGKTLTAESIADYLKCPLYVVSAGELGTNSRTLEADLNRIMDICHSWGAILLLDEADVFLEQRQAQDVHRNALVSVFLRLLEYYQGILFLTTNRVETFDEAFQSRIHMGIRYEILTFKARREIWVHHIGKIQSMKDQECKPLKNSDFDELAKKVLNGRQIKNAVATSQSIALAEGKPFSLDYIKRLLDTQDEFDADMKGGKGYRDAMNHYT